MGEDETLSEIVAIMIEKILYEELNPAGSQSDE
jgi:hypothetical protein